MFTLPPIFKETTELLSELASLPGHYLKDKEEELAMNKKALQCYRDIDNGICVTTNKLILKSILAKLEDYQMSHNLYKRVYPGCIKQYRSR
jgi:hypothetical protein